MTRPTKRSKEPPFEAAVRRLEEIVAALEEGDRPLDESLRLFEEGVALTRQCSRRLDEAQRRIEILTRNADGELETAPFEPEADGGGEPGVPPADDGDD